MARENHHRFRRVFVPAQSRVETSRTNRALKAQRIKSDWLTAAHLSFYPTRVEMFDSTTLPIGKQISLPRHFDVPIMLEGVRPRHPPETEPLFVKPLQRHFKSRGAQTVGGIVQEITNRRIVVNRARDNHVVSG